MTERTEALLAKIRALRAKTTAAGCTEAEALAATELANKLMGEHEIAESQLATEDQSALKLTRGIQKCFRQDGHEPKAGYCIYAIGELTGTKGVSLGHAAAFVGDRADVETACWLFAVIDRAIETEYAAFAVKNAGSLGRSAKPNFQHAMVSRICNRIREMVNERRRAMTGSLDGRWLVLVDAKAVAVKAKYKELYPRTYKSGRPSFRAHGDARRAGRAAGDRVSLGRAIGGGGPAMIGGK